MVEFDSYRSTKIDVLSENFGQTKWLITKNDFNIDHQCFDKLMRASSARSIKVDNWLKNLSQPVDWFDSDIIPYQPININDLLRSFCQETKCYSDANSPSKCLEGNDGKLIANDKNFTKSLYRKTAEFATFKEIVNWSQIGIQLAKLFANLQRMKPVNMPLPILSYNDDDIVDVQRKTTEKNMQLLDILTNDVYEGNRDQSLDYYENRLGFLRRSSKFRRESCYH
jgi:hypothetical protein